MKQFEKESLESGVLALIMTVILVVSTILAKRMPADNEFFIFFAFFFLMFQTIRIMEKVTDEKKTGNR